MCGAIVGSDTGVTKEHAARDAHRGNPSTRRRRIQAVETDVGQNRLFPTESLRRGLQAARLRFVRGSKHAN